MFKRYFILISIVIATLALSLIYREDAPLRILAIEVILFAIIILCAVINGLLFKFRFWTAPGKMKLGKDNKKAYLMFSFTGGIFVLPVKGELILKINNNKLNREQKLIVPFYVSIRHNRIKIPIEPECSGLMEIQPVGVRIYEATGLVGMYKKITADKKKILVFPENYPIHINNMMGKNYYGFADDATEFHKDHPGDDPSEIFEHREFQDGDRMSRVNWKLSVREKKLMVKEMSDPIREPICICMGLNTDSVSLCNMGICIIYSLAASLIFSDVRFAVLIFDEKTKNSRLVHVKDVESLDEAMTGLLTSDIVSFYDFTVLTQDDILMSYSKLIYVTAYDENEIERIKKNDDNSRIDFLAVSNSHVKTADNVICFHEDNVKKELENLWLDIV